MKKESNQKLNWNYVLPLILLFTGISLLVYMITFEDEPGAIPLILICTGLVLLAMNWHKSKKEL